MSNYKIKFTSSDVTADPLSTLKEPFVVTEGTVNDTSTSLSLCGHNYPNYGELLWTNIVHLLENFAGMSEPSGMSTIGQLWYDSTEGKLKVYKGDGVGEGYQYISGDDGTLFNETNFNEMLKTFDAPQHVTPYFDNRYIKLSGGTDIGTLELAWNSDIVVTGEGMVKVSAEPVNGEDVVNRSYLAKVFSLLGYNIDDLNAITSLYLPLTGGTMSTDAVITVPKSIEILSNPTEQNHAITKGYAEDNFVSFGINTKAIAEITMSGPLYLSSDSCDLPDDSLQAVPAQWVTDKLSKFSGGIGSGLYIPITATGTTVSNNLTFTKNNWLKVDLDAANWSDQTLVLNQARANSLYVKKTGDSLTAHPFTFTQPATQPTAAEEKLDALNVPTAGWVNHRIADAVAAGGAGGPTVSKLSVYGPVVTIPASRRAYPTTPDSTITLTIPSNTNAIDYELRFGATVAKSSGGNSAPYPKFDILVDGNPLYSTMSPDVLFAGALSQAAAGTDVTHSCKYTATANTVHTITVNLYCINYGGTANVGSYPVNGWIIADPLSATVAIQATNAPPAGSVTSGPAGSVTYVDFGNGMVMISGITYCTQTGKNKFGDYTTYYMYTDVTFPNNIQLKLPYGFSSAMNTPSGALATLTPWVKDPANRAGGTASAMTSTGFNLSYAYGAVGGGVDSRLKNPLTYPIYWTVTGFKA